MPNDSGSKHFHFLIEINTNMYWAQLNEGTEYAERIVDEYTLHQVLQTSKT